MVTVQVKVTLFVRVVTMEVCTRTVDVNLVYRMGKICQFWVYMDYWQIGPTSILFKIIIAVLGTAMI